MNKNIARIGVVIFVALVSLISGCSSNRLSHDDELSTSSDQTPDQKRARIRLQLAVGYYQQRENQVALDEVKKALQADPNLADAYGVRALIYMDMGETKLAEENFQFAMKLAPNNPELSNNYGWFLCKNGRAKESISYFEAALKIRSYESPEKALNNAGLCSIQMKDTASAEHYFSRAFKINPANPSTNVNLAKLYYERGDGERAHFYISRVLKDDIMTAEVLWLAIKIERKLGDRVAETSLVTQLSRRYPDSHEFSSYQRGAFDE